LIGQKELLKTIERQLKNNDFPQFTAFVGNGLLDKLELVGIIAKELKAEHVITVSPKVDDVREIITNAYTQRNPIVYGIMEIDNVSAQAKNSLLKLAEEPPKNVYIIISVKDPNNLLKTLKSRAAVYNMQHYTQAELEGYIKSQYPRKVKPNELEMVYNICETPDEIDLLLSNYEVADFWDYVELVADNIAEVSGANSFKIADKLRIKDTDYQKYDLSLFFKAFQVVCAQRYKADRDSRYFDAVAATGKALNDMTKATLNKQMLVDNWILDVRKALR